MKILNEREQDTKDRETLKQAILELLDEMPLQSVKCLYIEALVYAGHEHGGNAK